MPAMPVLGTLLLNCLSNQGMHQNAVAVMGYHLISAWALDGLRKQKIGLVLGLSPELIQAIPDWRRNLIYLFCNLLRRFPCFQVLNFGQGICAI